MKSKDKEKFEQYCRDYANRFIYCVCKDTSDKWLHTMAKFKLWRIQEELEDKHNIIFKTTDKEAYNTYERIFVEVLTKRIEQCKLEDIEKQKKAKEDAKDKKKKGKK